MRKKTQAIVSSQRELSKGIFDMWLTTDLARECVPGQFVSVYPKGESMLLPRPISICETDVKQNRIRLVYRVAGNGTREFSGYREGDTVLILGSLGNGFPVDVTEGKRVFLIGGGIGIPPMLETARVLAEEGKAASVTGVFGYRDANLFLKEELERYCNVFVATEDGSIGTKGNVLNAIQENHLECDMILACGPMPMLRALKKYAEEAGCKAYISLEERMACGVGACLGCVCKTTHKDHHSQVNRARVCSEGPVFVAEDVEI